MNCLASIAHQSNQHTQMTPPSEHVFGEIPSSLPDLVLWCSSAKCTKWSSARPGPLPPPPDRHHPLFSDSLRCFLFLNITLLSALLCMPLFLSPRPLPSHSPLSPPPPSPCPLPLPSPCPLSSPLPLPLPQLTPLPFPLHPSYRMKF